MDPASNLYIPYASPMEFPYQTSTDLSLPARRPAPGELSQPTGDDVLTFTSVYFNRFLNRIVPLIEREGGAMKDVSIIGKFPVQDSRSEAGLRFELHDIVCNKKSFLEAHREIYTTVLLVRGKRFDNLFARVAHRPFIMTGFEQRQWVAQVDGRETAYDFWHFVASDIHAAATKTAEALFAKRSHKEDFLPSKVNPYV